MKIYVIYERFGVYLGLNEMRHSELQETQINLVSLRKKYIWIEMILLFFYTWIAENRNIRTNISIFVFTL